MDVGVCMNYVCLALVDQALDVWYSPQAGLVPGLVKHAACTDLCTTPRRKVQQWVWNKGGTGSKTWGKAKDKA